ncbi:peroxiredoxin [Devosia pacifica]|uniref:thioredoxin-dependent peroxiredoxin n=1 Tax=Devosia pacifica TaxID=1335967 RepID=A0A918RUD7_9HYPH|nr:peroxiredoxin [Devosia pacifica]
MLFFYPKDDTEGCTKENLEFSELQQQFRALGANLMGISPDTVEDHRKFSEKHALKVDLLADPDRSAIDAYGLWRTKKLYGREFPGLVRTTFLIDADGRIVDIIPARRIKGHAQRALDALRQHLRAA